MGKPFGKELELIYTTASWSNSLDVHELSEFIGKIKNPVYIVGSGGSFSSCVYAADLLTSEGIFAKAITPLELFYCRSTIRKSSIIFISASGSNTDILFAFKKAIEFEPVSVINICMKKGSKLAALSLDYSCAKTFEFTPPAGKDGFLATNTLVAYFILLYRSVKRRNLEELNSKLVDGLSKTIESLPLDSNFVILFGGFTHAVAVDLESKFSEAGLAPSILSDFRHFAHGRHQWFDKRKNSTIIALCGPSDSKLCYKTLGLLPAEIPKIVLQSDKPDFDGVTELLIMSFQIIKFFGIKKGIDPGKPGVPEYGSKIYHLRYDRLLNNEQLTMRDVAIARKSRVSDISLMRSEDKQKWGENYDNAITRLTTTRFGSVILDYDGTLCSSSNRFLGPGNEIKSMLKNFVRKGFVLGVVSGRGKSLKADLEMVFERDKMLMKNVVVGYYNGSDIGSLDSTNHPRRTGELNSSLAIVASRLSELGLSPDSSPNQLMFGAKSTQEWDILRDMLLNEVMLLNLPDIVIVESSHSIDIVPRGVASKNNILAYCHKLTKSLGLANDVLCIGDKGQWPGNDYVLLSNLNSLSVGEVSTKVDTGWNISPPGIRDEKAVAYIFSKIVMKKNYFTLVNL